MRPAAPALRAMPPAPFADDAAHLQAALAALDAVLRARVDRVRASLGGDPWLRGLNVDDATVDALLDRSPLSAPWPAGEVQPAIEAALQSLADDLAAREAATLAAGRALRLLDLRARFGLDDLAAEVVLLALAPELDDRYARLIGWLHDDLARNRPSVGLCLDLFGGPLPGRLQARRAFAPDAPLLTSGLVTLGEANHWRDRPVKLALGLVRWLLGEAPVDPSTGARVVRLPVDEVGDADSLESYGDRLVKSIRAGARHAVNVSGPPGGGKRARAARFAAALGRPLYVLDAAALADDDLAATRAAAIAAALAARLDDAPLCVRRFDALDDHPNRQRAVLAVVADRGPRLLCFTTEQPWQPLDPPPGLPPVEPAPIALPAADARAALWRDALGDAAPDDTALVGVSDAFRFAPGRIRAAAATARGIARAAGAPVDAATLSRAARLHATPKLGALAQGVRTAHGWHDLILPDDRKAQLAEIIARVQHRTKVLDRWGFGRKLAGDRGTSALFCGAPGTGKTMAAALIAAEAGRDLYRIDLSQVVSKFIGETEKHLERVFTEAESTDAALFFDEADALFGKRGEVSDAHDRYANIEVGYLLQRLERFGGLAILATNLRKNMDEAFLRRLDLVVEFPEPDRAQRAQLWAGVWPPEAPRADDLDAELLAARFELSGGHIRNIALSAAFAAADEDTPIALRHVFAATRAEYRKLNKLVDGRLFTAPEPR